MNKFKLKNNILVIFLSIIIFSLFCWDIFSYFYPQNIKLDNGENATITITPHIYGSNPTRLASFEYSFNSPDGRKSKGVLNFSDPENVGTGENMMALSGLIQVAFTEKGLECFQELYNFSLQEISLQEAKKLKDPNKWLWINNTFFKIIPKSNILRPNNCSIQDLKTFNKGTHNTNTVLPTRVEVELIGNISNIFFAESEIKPTLIFKVFGNPSFNKLHTEYIDLKGNKSYDIQFDDSFFIFDKNLKLNNKYIFAFPWDIQYSEIYNIYPHVINSITVPISIKNQNPSLDGKGYFTQNYIKLEFKRTYFYKLKVIISELFLVVLLFRLKRKIIYLKKGTINFKLFIKNIENLFSIIGFIMVITYSFKFIFNLISLIPLIILIQILILSFKKFKKFKESPNIPLK